MKNKKLIFPILWLVNILLLLISFLVVINKDNYNIFMMLIFILIFITPLILIVMQFIYEINNKSKEENNKINKLLSIAPNVGCIMVMLLTCINYIQTIEKQALFQMFVILFVFICFELYFGYISYTYYTQFKENKTQIKKWGWLHLATYILLVGFYLCALIMSYDWSIV